MIRTLVAAAAASLLLAGAAAAQPDPAAFQAACGKDFQALCAGVQPGGGRIMACFKEHQDKLSAGCKTFLAQAMAARRDSAPGTSAPATH